MWRKSEEVKPSPSSEASQGSLPAVSVDPPRHFSTPAAPARVEPARISASISIQGEITGREDLFVDGEIHGTIRINGASVTVGPNGRVHAEIEAREIVVEGAVHGDLTAAERVHIRRSGVVGGEVTAPRLAIDEGAVLRGKVEMPMPAGMQAPENLRPAPARARSMAASGAGGLQPVPVSREES